MRQPLSQRSSSSLRGQADEYRRMAETARGADVVASLQKLADRYEAAASDREAKPADNNAR
jgi:hypothetical protein